MGCKSEGTWGGRAVNHLVYHETARSRGEHTGLMGLDGSEFCDRMRNVRTSIEMLRNMI
jgi:hypothetical protein